MDIDSILNGDLGNLFDPSAVLAPLMPFIMLTIVASVVIVVLYIFHIFTAYRSHKAVIETRDILREMNERDKARSSTNATKAS